MNSRWYRWAGYMDELEDVLQVHGSRLADIDSELRELYQRGHWPASQERVAGAELVRRAYAVPFLRELIQEARGLDASQLQRPADGNHAPWTGSVRHVDGTRRRTGEAPLEPAEGPPPVSPVPARLLAAERALAGRTRSIVLVLEALTNPRNAAAVARTAEFFGVQGLYLIQPEGRTPLQRSIARSCDRFLDLHWYRQTGDALEALRAGGYRILVADHGENSRPVSEVELGERVAVVLGNEQLGVSAAMRAAADGLFFIEQFGFGSYLNVAAAASIALYEVDRRMRAAGSRTPLEPADRAELRRHWYQELAGGDAGRAQVYRRWLEHPPDPAAVAPPPPSREKARED